MVNLFYEHFQYRNIRSTSLLTHEPYLSIEFLKDGKIDKQLAEEARANTKKEDDAKVSNPF